MGDSIRPGDRVRVHTDYEATVDWMDPYRYAVTDDDGHGRSVSRIYRGNEVTKIEPPFKPGDRLRYKSPHLEFEVTLAETGYIHHHYGHKWIPCHQADLMKQFTSDWYEKVNI